MHLKNITPTLCLLPVLISCASTMSPEQATLIDGLQQLYALHRPVTEDDISRAFGTDFSKYEKYCNTEGAGACSYHTPDWKPISGQLLSSVSIDKFVGPQLSPAKGWGGEQLQLSFNEQYCLTADDFGRMSGLAYKQAPPGRILDNGGSVSWPARVIFKDPRSQNTLTFDEGCKWYVRQETVFDVPVG